MTTTEVHGEFVDFQGERYYAIRSVDRMAPFFMSIVSNLDHWLFVSSTGGLTAGRISPETALFPYITVDKIHESLPHTGPRTMLRAARNGRHHHWEPFNREHFGRFEVSRHLYKNLLGNKVCFEEINHDLALVFRYTWATSGEYGFVRLCELENRGHDVHVEIVDGLQNILPAGTPRFTQSKSSNLVDAYKWTELDRSGLALFTLYSKISDRPEPRESLKANVAYCLGLDEPTILLSSEQLDAFRAGAQPSPETHKRGIRGAFFVSCTFSIPEAASRRWRIVTDVEHPQVRVVALRRQLADSNELSQHLTESITTGSDELASIMAACDAFQLTAEEHVTVHHYANVLFNVLRGGCFYDQYNLPSLDFATNVAFFNKPVYERHASFLTTLPETLAFEDLLQRVKAQCDAQLTRLCLEYLPITFGRRHGDPSRPWNQFTIRLKDEAGNPLLSYEGNWRDIFQNWEALAMSYPELVENMIAKFANASTLDGHNPYRITKKGIDWEVEDPEDPWSYIGYWGDHQIIYLLKLLEISSDFHPERLSELLHLPTFAYANVPYRIRSFTQLVSNPKETVDFDDDRARLIEELEFRVGADAKLLLDAQDEVVQVTLLEKLLVPLLAKLGNLVVDGGIWLNTQRPEWNDANNALVGQGLSMVTLYHMRRYVTFLHRLLTAETGTAALSNEVSRWLSDTAEVLDRWKAALAGDTISAVDRYALLSELGKAASRHREAAYRPGAGSDTTEQPMESILRLLADALSVLDHSIRTNRRSDGLYHAYNVVGLRGDTLEVQPLYPMLEGQVAALSSGALDVEESIAVVEALFASDIYRADQESFMLYPDRALPSFLEKNTISAEQFRSIPFLEQLRQDDNEAIVVQDANGSYRFNADLSNASDLRHALERLTHRYGDEITAAREPIERLYEAVFNHRAFTGRSGTMFGFEGLGCIYWHMVSKLLLAVQENFFGAVNSDVDAATLQRLGELYYRIRHGLGFNKTPSDYGAFPTDPYSHTTGHSGARQPGMTGQVKEEVLTRFGELGVRVQSGVVRFDPSLLRAREFLSQERTFRFLDVEGHWQLMDVPAQGLAFTWCQVPIVYVLGNEPAVTLERSQGPTDRTPGLSLTAADSAAIFKRRGLIRRVTVTFPPHALFDHE
ncbi:MAG: hypothetical protein ACFB9M_02855 [Myxococcota bacterium]